MKPLFLFTLLFFVLYVGAQDSSVNKISNDTVNKSPGSVNIPATFPRGSEVWKEYLNAHLIPATALDNGAPPGKYTVVVSYVIDTTGKITQIQILEDPGYGAGNDVRRVLKNSPQWIPATMNGRKVRYRQKQSFDYFVDQQ